MSLYKNCVWWKNFDCIFEFSVKSYVRNTINLSCAKIVFLSVISKCLPIINVTKSIRRLSSLKTDRRILQDHTIPFHVKNASSTSALSLTG